MNFSSDNSFGAPPEIIEAIAAANHGAASSYGSDDLSKTVEAKLADVFERDVSVFQISTGTAANALALASLVPPYGAILCHEEAHIMVDECGAPEFYTGGAKLIGLPGDGAKLSPETVSGALKRIPEGFQHHVVVSAISLTQATECGRIYQPSEVAALSEIARTRDMAVHMDGARFANAIATLGCAPADVTWHAGVDVLSFGATKNGCLAAEAVIIFDRARADDMRLRRKRAGHLISKSRFLAAQLNAYLTDDLWLRLAENANRAARRLSEGLVLHANIDLAWPVEANEVFAILPRALANDLLADGAVFYEWPGRVPDAFGSLGKDKILARFVCAFNTSDSDVDAFLALTQTKNAPD